MGIVSVFPSTVSRRMKLFTTIGLSLATLAYAGQNVYFDSSEPCKNFDENFGTIAGMTGKCKTNRKKNKYFCNLKCANGYENVWSTRPIKCKIDKNDPTQFKWKPNKIKNADQLCEEKDDCGRVQDKYNVTNKLLSWTKEKDGRSVHYTFACANMKSNGKEFAMVPYPEDTATCVCNYNKPSNIRCKWSKIKKSIVRCVRADRPKGQSDFYYEDAYNLYDSD